jgi:AraC-like DNA-binding protein
MKTADVSSLRMLRQARDRIDRDYAGQIGIPALAAGAGYSREHFIRAFRAAYGETPGRYRTRRRVERACELLRRVHPGAGRAALRRRGDDARRLGQLVQLYPAQVHGSPALSRAAGPARGERKRAANSALRRAKSAQAGGDCSRWRRAAAVQARCRQPHIRPGT